MSKGGSSGSAPSGGGSTNTVINQSQPPQAFLDAYTNLNQRASDLSSQPYPGPYTGQLVAGFTPQQTQAMQTVGDIQGQYAPYLNTAAQAFTQATQPLWPSLPQYDTSGLPSAGVASIGNAEQYAAAAAQPIAQTVSPYAGLASSAAQNIPGAVSPLTTMAADAAQNVPGQVAPYTGFAGSTAANLQGQVAPYTGFAGSQAANLQGQVQPYTGFAGSTAAGLQGQVQPYTGFAGSTASNLQGQVQPYTGFAGSTAANLQNQAQPYAGMAAGAGQSVSGTLAPATGFAQQTAAGLGSQVSPYTSGATQAAGSTLGNVQNYLSPYTQNVTNALTGLFNQQNAQQLAQVRGSSVGQGAYGGDREAVAEALTAQQQALAQAPTLANVLQQGYQSAQQQAAQQAALQAQTSLGAGQLTTQAGLGAGQLGLAGGQLGLSGLQTTGQLGLGAGQLTTSAGQAAGQLGLGAGQLTSQTGQAAGQLGLGAGQLTSQTGQAAGQLGLGAGQLTSQTGQAAGQLGLGAGQLTSQTGQAAGQLGLGAGQLTSQTGLGAGQLANTTAQNVNQALTSAGQLGLGAGQLMSGAMGTQGQLGLGAGQLNLAAGQGLMQDFSQQQQTQMAAEQANAWLASQAGVGFAGLGSQQQQLGLSGAASELQSGALQQQLAQEQLNIPYEQYLQQQAYPYQQLNFLAPIAEGTGSLAGGSSSTSYPGPSLVSQLGGLGLAGAGIAGATGGFGSNGWLTGSGGLLGGFGSAGNAAAAAANEGVDFTSGSAGGGLLGWLGGLFSSGGEAAVVKTGGRVGFASGGDTGLGSMPLGQTDIPQVPVLSLDYIQAPGPAIKGQGPPKAPSLGAGPQGQSDTDALLKDVQLYKGMKDIGVFKGLGDSGSVNQMADGGSLGNDEPASYITALKNFTDIERERNPYTGYHNLGGGKGITLDLRRELAEKGLPGFQRGGGLGTSALDHMAGGLHMPHAGLGASLTHMSPHLRLQGGGMGEEPLAAAAPLEGVSPNTQTMYQQFQQMPFERLQELSLRLGQSTPQGRLAQRALTAKQMTPGAGLGASPTGPSALPTNFLPMQPQGGAAQSMADGGSLEPLIPASEWSMMTNARDIAGERNPFTGKDTLSDTYKISRDLREELKTLGLRGFQAGGDTSERNFVTEDELDPHPVVDHSGDTIKVHYPSERTSLDLGLPTSFKRRALAAGGSSGSKDMPPPGSFTLGSGSGLGAGENPTPLAAGAGLGARPGTIPELSTQSLSPVGNPFANIHPVQMPNVGQANIPQPMTYRNLSVPPLGTAALSGGTGSSPPIFNIPAATPATPSPPPPPPPPPASPPPPPPPPPPPAEPPIVQEGGDVPNLTPGQTFRFPDSQDTFQAVEGGGFVDISVPGGNATDSSGGGGDGKRGGAMRPRRQEGGPSDDLSPDDIQMLKEHEDMPPPAARREIAATPDKPSAEEAPPPSKPQELSAPRSRSDLSPSDEQTIKEHGDMPTSNIPTTVDYSRAIPGLDIFQKGLEGAAATQGISQPQVNEDPSRTVSTFVPARTPSGAGLGAAHEPMPASGLGINQQQLGRETAFLTGQPAAPQASAGASPFESAGLPSWQMTGLGAPSSLGAADQDRVIGSAPSSGAREIPNWSGPTPSASTAPPGGTWGNKLGEAADRYGIPRSLIFKTAQIESGMHPNPQAGWPNNNVLNLNERNWKDMGGGDIGNPDLQADHGAKWLSQMHQQTKQLLGHDPEDWQSYILFQQGPGGGPALLRAPPGMNVVDALTPAYKGDRATAMKAVTGNAGSLGMTAQQFVDLQRQRFEGFGGRMKLDAPLPSGGTQVAQTSPSAPGLGAGALAGTGEPSAKPGASASGLGMGQPTAGVHHAQVAESPWFPMMAAGFGMMASRSPYPLQALGEGGLQGIKAAETAATLQNRSELTEAHLQRFADLAQHGRDMATAQANTLDYRYKALDDLNKARGDNATIRQQMADTAAAAAAARADATEKERQRKEASDQAHIVIQQARVISQNTPADIKVAQALMNDPNDPNPPTTILEAKEKLARLQAMAKQDPQSAQKMQLAIHHAASVDAGLEQKSFSSNMGNMNQTFDVDKAIEQHQAKIAAGLGAPPIPATAPAQAPAAPQIVKPADSAKWGVSKEGMRIFTNDGKSFFNEDGTPFKSP